MPPASSLTPSPAAGNQAVLGWVQAIPYLNLSRNACESIHTDFDVANMQRELFELVGRLNARPMAEIYANATAGSPDDMLELALRYTAGVTTPQQYPAAMLILTALTNQSSTSRRVRGRAYSILAHIHHELSQEGGACNIDSVFRAAQAADVAAGLGFVSPVTIQVAEYIERIGFRRQSDCKWAGHSTARFEQLADMWRVYDKRKAEVERQKNARKEKVIKAPNAYICAAAGCGIEATHKAALQSCSGKCRAEGKPSYCSKDCQRKDWKRHKPFCQVGAPLDEVAARRKPHDPTTDTSTSEPTTGKGHIWQPNAKHERSVDVPHPILPGQSIRVSSQTMDPTFLKEFREAVVDNI